MLRVQGIKFDKPFCSNYGYGEHYHSGLANPQLENQRVQLTLTVVDELGNPPLTQSRVEVATNQNPNMIDFFDHNYISVPATPGITSFLTDDKGILVMYFCARYPVIITLDIRHESMQSFTLRTLVFCDSLDDVNGLYPLNVALGDNGVLQIPPWNRFDFAANANANKVPPENTGSVAFILNDELIPPIVSIDSLREGCKLPYELMKTGGRNNVLKYLLDTGDNRQKSRSAIFPVVGNPLVMPSPYKYAEFTVLKYGAGGSPRRLSTMDLVLNKGLKLAVTFVEGVRPGDTYDIYLYLNGYRNNQIAQAKKGPYTVIAPVDVQPQHTTIKTIPAADLIGFGIRGKNEWGYMWADCQVNNVGWTYPWGHIEIDFSDERWMD